MTDFMADREKEEEEANRKHTEELEHLRDNLNREFEEKLSAYEVCYFSLHTLVSLGACACFVFIIFFFKCQKKCQHFRTECFFF